MRLAWTTVWEATALRRVTRKPRNATAKYAEGHLLYLRENTLMAQPFDVDRMETTGEAVPVVEGVPTFGSPARMAGITVSSGGLLVVLTGASGRSQLVWKDRQGKAVGLAV